VFPYPVLLLACLLAWLNKRHKKCGDERPCIVHVHSFIHPSECNRWSMIRQFNSMSMVAHFYSTLLYGGGHAPTNLHTSTTADDDDDDDDDATNVFGRIERYTNLPYYAATLQQHWQRYQYHWHRSINRSIVTRKGTYNIRGWVLIIWRGDKKYYF